MCLLDSATTHIILRGKKYFSNLIMKMTHVNAISSSTKLIKGSERATLLLPRGIILAIDNALYYSKSQRKLLSFKVIRQNIYHIETVNEGNVEYLYITAMKDEKNSAWKTICTFFWIVSYKYLYGWIICHSKQRFTDSNDFIIWYDRLGHFDFNKMHKIVEKSHRHTLKNQNIL